MISVVILTHNEAINIERCLASVAWSDDILVVDSGSTDGTQELAARAGARVVFRPFDNFAGQRNFALEQGQPKHPWVLHLDADEEVSGELRREMEQVAAARSGKPGYRVPFRLMLLGQWLKHAGMYPGYQVRFGQRDRLRFHMAGHGQRETLDPSDLGTLGGHLLHYNFSKGISEWMAKHARYARDEAVEALSATEQHHWRDVLGAADAMQRWRSLKALSRSLPMRPLLRFLYVYVGRLGLLDGKAGLRYAMLLAAYQWMIDMNIIELRTRNSREP